MPFVGSADVGQLRLPLCCLYVHHEESLCLLEPRQLTLGGLQVQCHCRAEDGLQRLALSRGLLTACRKDILAYGLDPREVGLSVYEVGGLMSINVIFHMTA